MKSPPRLSWRIISVVEKCKFEIVKSQMILPIYIYGQPVLRKVCEDITPDYPDLKQLITDMWETLEIGRAHV